MLIESAVYGLKEGMTKTETLVVPEGEVSVLPVKESEATE